MFHPKFKNAEKPASLILLCCAFLTACSSDGSTTLDEVITEASDISDEQSDEINNTITDLTDNGVTTMQIDATAGGIGADVDDPLNQWAYLDLDTAQLLDITDVEADSSVDWDIAFKRVDVKLNSGVSGPGDATGAIVDVNINLFDVDGDAITENFLDITPDTELARLLMDATESNLEFVADVNLPAINGDGVSADESWWLDNSIEQSVDANPSVWYLVRSSEGDSYAKFHVTDIVQSDGQITLELFIQEEGAESFQTVPTVWIASIGSGGGSLCYDFELQGETSCEENSDTWDLQLDVSGGELWNIWTNGGVRGTGVNGGSFGPLSSETQLLFADGRETPLFNEDSSGGVFSDYSWYAYNLQGNNLIWPTYRVYAINTGERVFRLQVIGYYDESGESGNLTVRSIEN